MIAVLLVILVLPLLLAAAAVFDLASFTIPNILPLLLLAAFAIFAIAAHLSPGAAGLHLAVGLGGLVLGFGLFARRYIGGGDAKLFAALALWLGWPDILSYLLVASLCGGVLTVALLSVRAMPLPALLARQAWLWRLHAPASGIPYGVALAAGGFILLPHSEIFRLAAAA